MVYRIRIRDLGSASESEVVVEASNPTEAIVKCRHLHGVPDEPNRGSCKTVTSIAAALQDPHGTW